MPHALVAAGKSTKSVVGTWLISPDVAIKTLATPASSTQEMYTEALNVISIQGSMKRQRQHMKRFFDTSQMMPCCFWAGLCLAELGQSDRGLEEARRALNLRPDNLTFINEFTVMLFNRQSRGVSQMGKVRRENGGRGRQVIRYPVQTVTRNYIG